MKIKTLYCYKTQERSKVICISFHYDNRVAIAWVSLIQEVETHHTSKKNGLINFSW